MLGWLFQPLWPSLEALACLLWVRCTWLMSVNGVHFLGWTHVSFRDSMLFDEIMLRHNGKLPRGNCRR
jgi:hypothetical protein